MPLTHGRCLPSGQRFDATEAMIYELRRLAANVTDDRDVLIDFEAETVSAVEGISESERAVCLPPGQVATRWLT